jgi:adenosine deaminase
MKSEHVGTRADQKLMQKTTLQHFPKIELHRHLEGTFSVPVLYEISLRNELDMPKDFNEFKKAVQFPRDSDPDFLKFLSKFRNDWYRSFEDIYDITYSSVKEFVNDNLFYIEVRFSPEHFAFHNGFDRAEVTRLIIDAGNKAANESGIYVKYLITFNRSKQDEDEMLELYELIKRLELEDIVGIDLAGDELNFPPELFQNFFARIHSDGLYKSTIHAGEVTPPEQVWYSIDKLNAARIGHGTSAIEDEKLQRVLSERMIALEQCITSNYQTGSWSDEENHPLGRLYRAGVPVTINSDDPFIQDTDLTDDYVKAVKYFDLTADDLLKLNLNALRSAFISESDRSKLEKEYKKLVSDFRTSFGV